MVKKTKLFHQDIFNQVSHHFNKPDSFYKLDRSGKNGKIKWLEEQIEHVFDLHYNNKIAISYISHKFNVNHETIRNIFKREGKKIVNHTSYQQVYTLNDNYFSKIDNPEKAYWLGFLYADGTLLERQNTIKLYLHNKDVVHIDMFRKAINTNYPIDYYVNNYFVTRGYKPSQMSGVKISSKQMFNDLCELGCTPRKSYSLKFPTEEQVPKELQRDFLRGFTDGDGSVNFATPKTKRVYSIEWGCCSEEMLNSILEHIKESGFDTKVNVRKTKNKNNFYKLKFTGNNLAREIINYLYDEESTSLLRKKCMVNDMNTYLNDYEELKIINKEAKKLDLKIEKYLKNENIGEIY